MRFLPSVGVHVGLEVIGARELPFAYVTLEGANSGMLLAVTHTHTHTHTHTLPYHPLRGGQCTQGHSPYSLVPLMGRAGPNIAKHNINRQHKQTLSHT